MNRIYPVILLIFLICSCSDRKCTESTVVAANLKSVSVKDGVESEKKFGKIVLKELNALVIFDTIRNNSSLNLLLNQEVDTSKFEIILDGNKDTLDIISRRDIHFISYECGFITNFNIDTIINRSNNFIDSIKVLQPSVTVADDENIKIYTH